VTYKQFVDVAIEKHSLLTKLQSYKDVLLKCPDKFIQEVAERVFDARTYPIDSLEKKRIKEYLKEFHQVEIDI
jgi:hypothetical protein